MTNTLYYGDNLPILREYFADDSVDLIYLDPPFNSNRSYNVLFKDESGRDSEAQITAFEDSWHWGPATERLYREILQESPGHVAGVLSALIESLGRANQICAYLVMMTARLSELQRVLKPSGSIYLHCDPTASHYLKLIMDVIFGGWNFRNEIVWKRTSAHNDAKRYGRIHDVILYYCKDVKQAKFKSVFVPYSEKYIRDWFKQDENGRWYKLENLTAPYRGGPGGRFEFHGKIPGPTRMWSKNKDEMERLWQEGRIMTGKDGKPSLRGLITYLDEKKGMPVQDWWGDIDLGNRSNERLGYPTQKPLALLERIINASSNPGDLVLDPFCGCGTAIDAAHALGRRWAGIDITHLSVALMKYRLRDRHGLQPGQDYAVIGEPATLPGARQLASEDRYQFQWWALSLVGAKPLGAPAGARRGKRGADRGIDGLIHFLGDGGKARRVIIQVKSGGVKSGDIRDLRGALERESAAIAAFITLEAPSREMTREALAAGYYQTEAWGDFPRLQLLTIEGLLAGSEALAMPGEYGTFARARRARDRSGQQEALQLE